MMITSAMQANYSLSSRATRASGDPADTFSPGEAPAVNKAMLNALFTGSLTNDNLVAWQVQLPGGEVTDKPTFGPDGTVYVPQSGSTAVIDIQTGALKNHPLDDLCRATAAVTPNGDLYLPLNGLTRFTKDMLEVWNQPNVPYSSNPPLVAADGGVFTSSYSPTGSITRTAPDGTEVWTRNVRRKTGEHMDTPMALSRDGKQLYAGGEGILYALDVHSGEILWGKGKSFSTIRTSCGPVVTERDTVVVSGGSNQVTCFDRSGKELWKWSAALEKRSDEMTRKEREDAFGWGNTLIESEPALSRDGKTILVAGDNKLMALDLDGNLQWKKELVGGDNFRDQSVQVGPDGNIYVKADSNSRVWAFNEGGEPIWEYENRSPSGSAFMAVNNDTVVFCTREGSCVALRKDNLDKRIAEAAAKPDDAPVQIKVGQGVVTIGGIRLKTKAS